jgi:transposase-like protein
MADRERALAVCGVRQPDLRDGGDRVARHQETAAVVVARDVVDRQSEDGSQRLGAATPIGAGELRDCLGMAPQAAPGMVRPGRDRLSGRVEVDESFVGGRGGDRGRSTAKKGLIVVAAEEVGRGIGRIRMHRVPDASADSLQAFVREAIEPGSLVHTDGWHGYDRLKASGYGHQITLLRGQHELASKLLPRVHRVVSLLKRWLLGTHQGAVSPAHLDYYLDEFTFRFNRRTSRHPGKLFFRLAEQAVAVEPAPYRSLVRHVHRHRNR